jgi:hypothetical protein
MFSCLVRIDPGPAYSFFIFAREQKCINNHSGLGFCAGMVVINSTKALKKFFIPVFSPKNFFLA